MYLDDVVLWLCFGEARAWNGEGACGISRILKECTGGYPTSYSKQDVYRAQVTLENAVTEVSRLQVDEDRGLFVSSACQAKGLRVLAERRSEGENVTIPRSGLA